MAVQAPEKFKATPHKDCGVIAPKDFLSDEAKNVGNPLWIHEAFCEIWRKIGKLASHNLCAVLPYGPAA